MRDTELKRKKADALYSVYKQGLQQGRFASLLDASRKIVYEKAPHFFISPKRASILLGRIKSKISLIDLNDSQRRLVWRLWYNYKDYLAQHPGCNLSRERILEMLVDEPAPEFYISPAGARWILIERNRQIRREAGW